MTAPIHVMTPEAAAAALGTDLASGLAAADAAERRLRFGPNRPSRPPRPPYLRLLAHQLVDPLVLLLVAAAVVSVAIGDTTEGLAIAAILVLNGALGFWQEASAERAILALSELFTMEARVVRDGAELAIAAEDVVPGDLLLVVAGERVAADARLVVTVGLEVDESALTGESLPVAKAPDPVGADTPLAERTPMLYAGTAVTNGHGAAVVCATGPSTEMGAIQALAASASAPSTPLTLRLGRLARQMVAVGVGITVVLGGVILLHGGEREDAFLTAVAVAVAAVPEGLAATVTAALALGSHAMAKRGAIVRRLAAIETLGETDVICTDKTGTLTQNRITVDSVLPAAGVQRRTVLEAAVLASAASRTGADPIDTALLVAAETDGVLGHAWSRVAELPFSSDRKRMSVVYASEDGRRVYTKGAPEVVATLSREVDETLLETADAWAADGLRVLAVATGRPDGDGEVERDLRLLGVVGLSDPLRPSALGAIRGAARAGIDVRMLTGDHPSTARTIGGRLGLRPSAISARVTPADKLALVAQLQAEGHVVAVTGDGINDAPALRKADVGVAMGRSGTEAAREAAAIVLTDDDFATIIAAVAEGRRIGDNIRKFVAFLLSANFGEVLVFAVAIGVGLGSPLAVIQVLVVNLVTDGLPALALARDPESPRTMSTPPRRGGALFDRGTWGRLCWIGILVGAVTFAAFLLGRPAGTETAQTMAFVTLALAELVLVFGMRSPVEAAWRLPRNRWLEGSVLVSALLVIAVVFVPGVQAPFATDALTAWQAAAVLGLSLLPLAGVELAKVPARRRSQ